MAKIRFTLTGSVEIADSVTLEELASDLRASLELGSPHYELVEEVEVILVPMTEGGEAGEK